MSAGDQLLSILVDTVGTIFTGLINAIFGSFIGPLFDAMASIFGL